jgi:hypothetical protein
VVIIKVVGIYRDDHCNHDLYDCIYCNWYNHGFSVNFTMATSFIHGDTE